MAGLHTHLVNPGLLTGSPLGMGRGMVYQLGVLDFAGGIVVHLNCGIAALALVFSGIRKNAKLLPHHLGYSVIGTDCSGLVGLDLTRGFCIRSHQSRSFSHDSDQHLGCCRYVDLDAYG